MHSKDESKPRQPPGGCRRGLGDPRSAPMKSTPATKRRRAKDTKLKMLEPCGWKARQGRAATELRRIARASGGRSGVGSLAVEAALSLLAVAAPLLLTPLLSPQTKLLLGNLPGLLGHCNGVGDAGHVHHIPRLHSRPAEAGESHPRKGCAGGRGDPEGTELRHQAGGPDSAASKASQTHKIVAKGARRRFDGHDSRNPCRVGRRGTRGKPREGTSSARNVRGS